MSFNGSISLSQQLLIPDLPQDIITEILRRLPVKTLLRFKSVSKSWLYLIENPKFISTHLMKSSNINNYTHHRLIMKQFCTSSGKYGYNPKSCSLHSIFYPPSDINNNIDSIHDVELDYPLKDPNCHRVSIVGSCNGLVCVVIKEDSIFIWNPLTRESKKLPNSGMRLSHHWNSVFGFGYDQLKDDYKVVLIVPNVTDAIKVMIYSLRNNSWGEISDDFPRAHRRFDNGTFVNGALHWPSYSSNIIVSLNLSSEAIGQIAAPDYGDRGLVRKSSVLEGCLCIGSVDHICADIWIMKKYGIRDSWTKLCTIQHMTYEGNNLLFHNSPLSMSMNGEILLLRGGESLVLYDPIYGTFRNPKIPNLSSSRKSLGATVYFESLVSPHMYDKLWRCPRQQYKTGSWRQIGDFPHDSRTCMCEGILLNGVLHWATDFDSGNIIVSLDLKSETYGKIAKPNYVKGDTGCTLSVLQGCICVCYNFAAIRDDIWVMKEYGIKDSWVKVCTIPHMSHSSPPLCFFMAGEILVKNGDSLVLYDPKFGTCRDFKVCNLSIKLVRGLGLSSYVESLVSPGIYDKLRSLQH